MILSSSLIFKADGGLRTSSKPTHEQIYHDLGIVILIQQNF